MSAAFGELVSIFKFALGSKYLRKLGFKTIEKWRSTENIGMNISLDPPSCDSKEFPQKLSLTVSKQQKV